MQRRDFLTNGALLSGIGLLGGTALNPPFAPAAAAAPADKRKPAGKRQKRFAAKFVDYGGEGPKPHLTYYNYESQAWFRHNNTALTAYRANAAQKYPYWYPLAGPVSGLSLVAETAQPWPHHRGVFFGCDRVNGGNYWQESLQNGRVASQGFALEDINETAAVLTDRCLWAKPGGKPIAEDTRRFHLRLLDAKRYLLDASFAVRALTKITIEPSNHSLFGVRCAPDISVTGGGSLTSSTGLVLTKANNNKATTAQILGKPARWLAFHGKRFGGVEEGVAVLAPEGLPKPFDKNLWFFRDYGNISPTPLNFMRGGEKIIIEEGDTLRVRYRLVAFAGTPASAGIDALWEEFNAAK
jgi:hypothetical protein